MLANLIDFHCHLDLYQDFEETVKECERAGIYTLAVTTTPRAWPRNKLLTDGLRFVRPALGLHPQLVGKDTQKELLLWEQYLPQADYIGEVGLDAGPDFVHTLEEQKEVFGRILELCEKEGSKIISIHAVRSVDVVLDMIEKTLTSNRNRVVLHWFTGSQKQARRAVELGCFFSINLPMIISARSKAVISTLPKDRLITESDGPFISYQSRQTRPADMPATVSALANVFSSTSENMQELLTRNLKSLLISTRK